VLLERLRARQDGGTDIDAIQGITDAAGQSAADAAKNANEAIQKGDMNEAVNQAQAAGSATEMATDVIKKMKDANPGMEMAPDLKEAIERADAAAKNAQEMVNPTEAAKNAKEASEALQNLKEKMAVFIEQVQKNGH